MNFKIAKPAVPSTSVGPAKPAPMTPAIPALNTAQPPAALAQPVPAPSTLPSGMRLRAGSVAASATPAAAKVPAVRSGGEVSEPVRVATALLAAKPSGGAAGTVGTGLPATEEGLNALFKHHAQPQNFTLSAADQFKELLTQLPKMFDQPQALGTVLRRVLNELNQNPNFQEFLAPEDAGMMVRALRVSYGTQLEIKSKNSKAAGKRKAKSAEVDGILDMDGLNNLLVDLS